MAPDPAPTPVPRSTVEQWAAAYITSEDLEFLHARPPLPPIWSSSAAPQRLAQPGRPQVLRQIGKSPRSSGRHRVHLPRQRAEWMHTFWHHELQAAELMAWAILAFPATPLAFRHGLLGIACDEIRHMGLYREYLRAAGVAIGAFPVRDWFWSRVSHCATPLEFVALMNLGLEGGNLDHTRRFESWFAAAGDHAGAALQRQVGDEEIAHVRFGARWFRYWTGGLDFDTWRAQLVPPLTPSLMRGAELDHARRRSASMPAAFLASLSAYRQ